MVVFAEQLMKEETQAEELCENCMSVPGSPHTALIKQTPCPKSNDIDHLTRNLKFLDARHKILSGVIPK
jgi:hypothetical protein